MNKRNTIAILLAVCMLASCGKAPEETTERNTEETTTTTAVEETTEETTVPISSGVATDISEFSSLTAGSLFTFGEYEGETIEWIVLDIDTDTDEIFCITKDIVSEQPYEEDGVIPTWNDSTLCYWLNRDFFEGAFTDEEKVRIESSEDTAYRLYVLSRADFDNYTDILEQYPIDQYWWLRTRNAGSTGVADCINSSGELRLDGLSCRVSSGIRPAMKIYIGDNEDRFDQDALIPIPEPSPTSSPTPTPAPATPMPDEFFIEAVDAEIPGPMPVDQSISGSENLVNYYEGYILETMGQSPLGPDEMYLYDTEESLNQEMDISGAVTYVIDDFDKDGEDDMIVPVFVEEDWFDSCQYYSNTNRIITPEHFYRLHLLLCKTDNGEVIVTYDYAMVIFTGDDDVSLGHMDADQYMDGFESICLCGRSINVYTIDRGDQVNIVITSMSGYSAFGDGSIDSAYELEVSDGELQYTSAFVTPGMGSADHIGYQYYFEDGEITSRETYYEEPEVHGADPEDLYGIDLYLDRIGIDNESGAIGDRMWSTDITDEDAELVAGMYLGPVGDGYVESDEGHRGFLYCYWVVT